jgi:thiol-disulfide isomerase/thioredoxin
MKHNGTAAFCGVHKNPNRRNVLAGMVALATVKPAAAADDTASPIAHGALVNNPLAQAFEPSPIYQLPDVTLIGPNGEQDVFDLIKGRTILMPLWAEWCTPCLSEIPDFARLQTKYGNASFAIVPVLTGARKKVTPDALTKIFGFLHASVFEPLIESKFGNRLMMVMAATHYSTEIPCNLLIAPNGRVIAREIGIKQSDDEAATAEQDLADKVDPVARAEAGETLSLWGKAAGEEFAAAMANGFLAQT